MAFDVQYEHGNIHSAVVVLGEDPANEDNVIISRLPTSVSVPKSTLNSEEGTPGVDEEGNSVVTAGGDTASTVEDPKDSKIRDLEAKINQLLHHDSESEQQPTNEGPNEGV